ncbi:hypothetical protein DFP73DRAFT_177995 [Morchella snyderi]|nr:hypothetical protein DFP73DRAFT_177995 [Morchella snyderi]
MPSMLAVMSISVILKRNKNPPDDVMDGSSLDEAFKLFESTYKQQPSSGQDELLKSIIHNAVTDHYQKGSAWLTKGSPILSWIIDLNDPEVTGWFLDEELAQLRDRMKALPSPDEHFAYSVNRFAKANTAEEYQTILETVPCRLPNVAYDRTKHFDAAWVNFVIQAMLALFGCYSNLDSCCNFREGWFDSNIWAPLIDHCLLGLDGVVVQRKEIKCFALKLIGNNNLRYDAIIHTARDFAPIEYAAIEVSRSIENEESLPAKKYVSDGTKLVTGMHSMLRRLHMLVDRDEEAIKDLQVVGMLNEGKRQDILFIVYIY